MENSPLDVFGQCRFLNEELFGWRWTKFQKSYCEFRRIPGVPVPVVSKIVNIDDLQKKFYSQWHRIEADVLDLPKISHQVIDCELSNKAARAYASLSRELIAEIDGGVITADNALVKLLRLQQITSGYIPEALTGYLMHVDSSKQDALQMLVDGLPANESIVVFGRFSSDLRCAAEVASVAGRPYLEVSGSRKDLTDHGTMVDTPGQILGVQIDSGGSGIDLTAANYVCYFSVGFSRGKYDQSLCRAHRPGQDKPVFVYHLQCRNTVDAYIFKALEAKADVVNEVLDLMRSSS